MSTMRISALPLDNAALWAHLFCPRKKPTQPAQLHQSQVDFADHPSKEKYACWGRRGGKSKVVGEVMIPRRAIKHPGIRQWLVTPTHEQAKIIFEYTANIMTSPMLSDFLEDIKWSPPLEMRFVNGSRFTARGLGHDGASARGFGADVVYADEAAFIKASIMDQVVFPLLTDSDFAEFVGISTPNGLNWFHEGYKRGEPYYRPGMPIRRTEKGVLACQSFWMPTWRNPFLNRDHLRAERMRRSSMAWDVEYGARFRDDQNAKFPWPVIEAVLDYSTTLSKPEPAIPGRRYVIGYDPADVHDRSALIVLDITERPWRIVAIYNLAGHGYEYQKVAAKAISVEYNNASILIDASHTVLMQNLYAMGVNIGEFYFTNEKKRDLLDNLLLVMEQKDIRIPFHEDLLTELKFYRQELNKAGTPVLGAPEGGFDDYVTALALAVLQGQFAPRTAKVEMLDLTKPDPDDDDAEWEDDDYDA